MAVTCTAFPGLKKNIFLLQFLDSECKMREKNLWILMTNPCKEKVAKNVMNPPPVERIFEKND